MKSIAAILLWLGFVSAACAQPQFSFFEPVQPARKVQIMAHRGLAMLAPENSLPAIQACMDDFIEWAEVDLRLSSDRKHVLLHDDALDRVTTSRGKVAETALAELLKMEAGTPFARRFSGTRLLTLGEVLNAAKGKLNLYLDCKAVDPELLVKEILDAGMEKQVLVYDTPAALANIRSLSGNRIAVMAKFRPKEREFDAFVKEVSPAVVEIDADHLSASLCAQFHDKGIKVQANTLGAVWDNPATWTIMVEAGVDYLQTDDPLGARFAEARHRLEKFPVGIAFHRGASRYAPENTLPAITRAVVAGADFIEIDIRPTKDGEYVLLHDSRLDRTTDGKGPIKEKSLTELRTLHAGAWFGVGYAETRIPTLDEALNALGNQANAYLDAKEITPQALVAAIKKHDLLERHVVYQSADYCKRIVDLEPAVKTIPGLKSAADLEKVLTVKPYGVDAAWSLLSKEFIERCHDKKIKVFSDALGPNETIAQYRRAIGWGIDVIQTDYPLRVLRAIELEAAR